MRKFLHDAKAATAIEYALIAALFALACIGGYSALSGEMKATYTTIGDAVEEATTR